MSLSRIGIVLVLTGLALLDYSYFVSGAEPAMPPADVQPAPIVLQAPKSVPSGSGYFKVIAVAGGPVSFDVEAQFDQADAPFQYEQLDAKTVLIGVPASAGVIRVEAAVAVAGGPPVFAKAFIDVTAPAKPKPPPGPPPVTVGKLFAVFVVDAASAPLAESPALLQALHAGGDEFAILDYKSPAVAAQNLTQFVADAGGAPCLILLDKNGDVHKAVKLPADVASILAAVKSAHAGR